MTTPDDFCDDARDQADEELFATLVDEARQGDWTYDCFMAILKDHGLERFASRVLHATVH
jgi:hypothetical protein